ncbi:MAG: HNH endonuclease [Bacteroidia bacterium]|nr:HNH endonuclease [Bacteroidia bacterium]
MIRKLPPFLRLQVGQRADFRCEYCRIHEDDSFLPFQVDHVVATKHGGGDEFENLAYACPHCNQFKGTDLVTFLKNYQDLVSIFHPRLHIWTDHFRVERGEIIPITRIGEATAKLLNFNTPERIMLRQILTEVGSYP